jgi:hypothetical protein
MANSLIKRDPEKKGITAFWREVRAVLDRDFPEKFIISEWSQPAEAIEAGFHIDMLLANDDSSLLSFLKKLIVLRKSIPAFAVDSVLECIFAEKGAYPLVFRRAGNGESYIVVINPKDESFEYRSDTLSPRSIQTRQLPAREVVSWP